MTIAATLQHLPLQQPLQPIKAIIFDHDGTLVDSEPVHLKCWQEVLEAFQQHLSLEDYRTHLTGMPSKYSATWLANKFNLDVDPDALLQAKQKILKALLTESAFPLMPDVTALLNYLQTQAIPLAIATGASRYEIDRSLKFHDLSHYFQSVVSKEEVLHNKPAPDVYLKAAEELGIEPQYCLAIEDSDNGERSALAAGMPCIRFYARPQEKPFPSNGFLSYRQLHTWLDSVLESPSKGTTKP